jgi:hypothetical protein
MATLEEEYGYVEQTMVPDSDTAWFDGPHDVFLSLGLR